MKAKSIALMLALLTLLGLAGCGQKETEQVSKPFTYSGYTEAEYSDYKKVSEYVEMSDGTKLAVDVYLPTGGGVKTSFPTIFQYTPYGRAFLIPESGLIDKIKMWVGVGTSGPVLDRANSNNTVYGSSGDMIKTFLSHGYAYVCADMRGTGASYGSKVDFLPQFADDGKELIDWMAKQEWCNGNVGMFGGSYLGYSQLVTASKQPAALRCIIPEVTAFDGYSGEIRPGGVFLWKYSLQTMQISLERNCFLPNEYCYPTAPVVDEDGDGDLTDELPIDKNGDGDFLNDYNYPDDPDDEPQYADGNKRQHIYYLATKDHEKNVPYMELGPATEYIDSEHTYDQLSGNAYTVSPVANIDGLMKSGIGIYNHGGWMDAFTRGTTELYCTLKDTNPSRLVIDAGYHSTTSPYWEYCGEDEKTQVANYTTEFLRFFDYYLKGIDNGIMNEDPVLIYNMNGDGWRTEKEWPLAREQRTDFFFGEDNNLSMVKAEDGKDVYRVDWSHSAKWGSYPTNRWLMETPSELPVRTELDKKCLTYTTAPVTGDTEVTGHPVVELYASSTAKTGDFFVYLEDVDEKGEAVLVTEGVLNASFAKLQNNDKEIMGGEKEINVLPELPWHGYEKADSDPEVFANGSIVKLTMDLMPTSWVFKTGHSIRMTIACADAGTFQLTPSLVPNNDATDPNNVSTDVTIYRGNDHPSKITLPIIPR